MQIIPQNMAVVPIQSMLEYLFLRVQLVQNGICIGMVAGCKDDYLIFLTHFSEKGESVWSDVDSDLDGHVIDFYFNFEVSFNLQIFDAMN